MNLIKKEHIYCMFVLLILYYLLFGNPVVNWHNSKLENVMQNLSMKTVTLEEIVPFEWDVVYSFDPYTSRKDIIEVIGFDSNEVKEMVSEYMTQLIFVKDKKIVSSIYRYPNCSGFYIDLSGARNGKRLDGEYDYMKYGDAFLFTVRYEDTYKYLQIEK